MMLQALAALYDVLAEKGTLEQPGWLPAKVSWGLELDAQGNLLRVIPLTNVNAKGKSTPQEMKVPAPFKRAVGIVPNVLCDNATYVFGVDDKGKPQRSKSCFEAFREKHHALLDGVDHPAAKALLAFLDAWRPEQAETCAALTDYLAEIRQGGNIVFCYEGRYLHEIGALRQAWQRDFDDTDGLEERVCLITGKRAPIQILHPAFRGIPGAQSSGASLVSFNATALESYGCENAQGLNAPVSTSAAFAYGAALNYLLKSPCNHMRMGENTVVFWSEDGEDGCSAFMMDMFDSSTMDDETLQDALAKVAKGQNADWNGMPLEPENRFYILGLAPNAARLSVRFFLCSTFGEMMKRVQQHQADLQIAKPEWDHGNELSLWWLLQETVNQKSRDKAPHAQMTGDLMRSILQGTPYPATLFEQVQLRIRAEQKITRGRAAIIKAYLLRQPNFTHKEVLTVNMNQETYQPYLLGRLFAVLEFLQEQANPGINATIRDRYFSSASATPAIVFPTLIRLAQAHLKKLSTGGCIYFDRQIGEIMAQLGTSYPARLSLQDQGVFQLGYYHQKQANYTKKEDKDNG